MGLRSRPSDPQRPGVRPPGARLRGARLRVVVLACVLLAPLLLAGGCSARSGSSAADVVPGEGLRGHQLAEAIAKPALTLTDTSGRPYDLRARTANRVTMMFFGYTHCADTCPAVMADIALALRQLAVIRSRVTVVFVTSDPVRDTPPVIKSWLAHFDRDFVGLTGDLHVISAAARKLGVPMESPKRQAGGNYTVNHGSQVVVFSTDGKARVVYTSDATAEDYAHDLPLILDDNRI